MGRARRLGKQLRPHGPRPLPSPRHAQVREELHEQSSAVQSTASRLKAEKRQAAIARQERDASVARANEERDKATEAKRREEAAKAALTLAKRELSELRKSCARRRPAAPGPAAPGPAALDPQRSSGPAALAPQP